MVLRAAIPFTLAGMNHILRITQGYATSTPTGATGLVDTGIFDLVTFNQDWGRWGAGISGTVPTGANGLSTEKWTAGPALGFVDSSAKMLNWGLFAQSYFSFAGSDSAPDVRLLNLQPILGYQLGEGRSISLGNSALVYDFEKSRWSSLMTSINYGQVLGFWGHKWRPNVEAGYDFNNDFGNQRWVFRAGITLVAARALGSRCVRTRSNQALPRHPPSSANLKDDKHVTVKLSGQLVALLVGALSGQCPAGGRVPCPDEPSRRTSWSSSATTSVYQNVSSLRRRHHGRDRRPTSTASASEGLRLTSFYAQPSCTGGRAAFITGQLPIRTGLTTVGTDRLAGRA